VYAKLLKNKLTMSRIIFVVFIYTATACIVSCSKEYSCGNCLNGPTRVTGPIARAGNDQQITLPINIVQVDGSASSSPDPFAHLIYTWTKISGPASFNIAKQDAIKTSIGNLVAGIYQFELKVDDGKHHSMDTLAILVLPKPVDPVPVYDGVAIFWTSLAVEDPRWYIPIIINITINNQTKEIRKIYASSEPPSNCYDLRFYDPGEGQFDLPVGVYTWTATYLNYSTN
jgi:hypothetical protein